MAAAPDLVLVPTTLERDLLLPYLNDSRGMRVELCGFGPVNAAAAVGWFLSQHLPRRVFLLGIAGSYGGAIEIGQAAQFSRVHLCGIGAGTGAAHTPSRKLGFMTDEPTLAWECDGIPLLFAAGLPCEPLLLTVCSAAANPMDVEYRLEQFPNAAAEDMEGYGVALACAKFDVPLYVIRGVSNIAGDRRREGWHVQPALQAAGELFHAVRGQTV